MQTTIQKILKVCKINKPEAHEYYLKIMCNSKKKLNSIYILKNI